MDKIERPFSLVVVAAIYFLYGLFDLLLNLSYQHDDLISTACIAIAFGLIARKLWALVGLKVITTILIFIFGLILVLQFINTDSSVMNIRYHSMRITSPTWLFNLVLLAFVGFNYYVAFSKNTAAYITGKKELKSIT